MIPRVATLTPREHRAVATFLDRVVAADRPRLAQAVLFGSKARGDFDRDSDVDVLLIFDTPSEAARDVGRALIRHAEAAREENGIALEPWAVAAEDLERGARTPMLVDALDDGLPLWPPGRPLLRLPFTPADACFCAACLLDWIAEGGSIARRALARGDAPAAAARARDDITRMATAALLLTGDTRHRRVGSLLRFDRRFVEHGLVDPAVRPGLAWARAAFPADEGRGLERPPASPPAAETAGRGVELAAVVEAHVVPWILARLASLRRGLRPEV